MVSEHCEERNIRVSQRCQPLSVLKRLWNNFAISRHLGHFFPEVSLGSALRQMTYFTGSMFS